MKRIFESTCLRFTLERKGAKQSGMKKVASNRLFALSLNTVLALFVLASNAVAQSEAILPVPSGDTEKMIVTPVLEADAFRPWVLTAHYSLLDLLVPNKIGVALARRTTDRTLWQIEYSTGSFSPFFISDVGQVTEERISLAHRFSGAGGGGFQWFYGAFYQKLRLHVGSAMLSRLSGGGYPSADLISMSGLGLQLGIGYRWIISEKFLVGFDIVSWSQPLTTVSRETKFLDVATNQNDRDQIETAVRLLQYFPRFAVAKFELGYMF
ncbi:hypothetical protein BH10BDE1_BH10BDE1_10790 [soil metagenome]